MRWKTPIIPAVPTDSAEADTYRGQNEILVDADSNGIVVAVGQGSELFPVAPSPAGTVSTALLDPSTGTMRWKTPGARALRLTDGAVLAAVADGGPTIEDLAGLNLENW